jgi:hypothetical protein
LGSAARIVPNVPSFAVDKGFWYAIPQHLSGSVTIAGVI